LLDTETTGLDAPKNEIIELGMVKFDYFPDGRVAGVRGIFSAFNEPSESIPPEVTALTGSRGIRSTRPAVASFVEDAVIVIAHNSGFDRKFVERYWPIFERKAWGCSATEIEWRKHGFEGFRLGYLLNCTGFFHQSHRAVDDCHALLEQARKRTMRVWAEQSPFDRKDTLKRRGYRWSDGNDGRPRSWYIDVEESAVADSCRQSGLDPPGLSTSTTPGVSLVIGVLCSCAVTRELDPILGGAEVLLGSGIDSDHTQINRVVRNLLLPSTVSEHGDQLVESDRSSVEPVPFALLLEHNDEETDLRSSAPSCTAPGVASPAPRYSPPRSISATS
jgi:DNA polymerase-3 subunit epsilon